MEKCSAGARLFSLRRLPSLASCLPALLCRPPGSGLVGKGAAAAGGRVLPGSCGTMPFDPGTLLHPRDYHFPVLDSFHTKTSPSSSAQIPKELPLAPSARPCFESVPSIPAASTSSLSYHERPKPFCGPLRVGGIGEHSHPCSPHQSGDRVSCFT